MEKLKQQSIYARSAAVKGNIWYYRKGKARPMTSDVSFKAVFLVLINFFDSN